MNIKTLTKSLFYSAVLWFSIAEVSAQKTQKIGDNPYSIDSKAVLELESTTKGFLPPRMTTAQMNAITSPTEGMMVYCTDCGVNSDGELRIAYNSIWQTFKGNVTGDISGNASTVTTIPNLTGPITSIGNTTSVASQTGTGTKFVMDSSPTFTGTVTIPTLVAGTNRFPTIQGTANQVLTTNGSGALSWATPSTTATAYSGVLPIANGGTGSSTQNFVDLSTVQTVAGAKIFSSDLTVNGITVGKGVGSSTTNLILGATSMIALTSGYYNIAIGNSALHDNKQGYANTVVGDGAVYYADGLTSDGNQISALGWHALHAEKGSGNTALGYEAGARGAVANTLTNSTFIGRLATAGSGTIVNATAIGNGAVVSSSNTIQLGNTSITNVKTSGTLTAGTVTYPNSHNTTAGQVLTTNASGVASWVTPTVAAPVIEVADEFTATASQTIFTLTQPPSANSKVKMYVNGIRISNTAYSVSGSTLTYVPANNGGYTITLSDRVQFDYFY